MNILTRLNKVIAYSDLEFIPVGNSAVCVATNQHYEDALITVVDAVPTDIDRYEYYYINGKFVKGDKRVPVDRLPEGSFVQDWYGIRVVDFGPNGTSYVGNLHYTMFGGMVQIYGDLEFYPKGGSGGLSSNTETRTFMFEGYDGPLVPPPTTLYDTQVLEMFQAGEATITSRTPICVTYDQGTLTVLDMPNEVEGYVLHVNIVYSVLGPEAKG